jgi:uncharacterized protein
VRRRFSFAAWLGILTLVIHALMIPTWRELLLFLHVPRATWISCSFPVLAWVYFQWRHSVWFNDQPRARWKTWLFDELYLMHWSAVLGQTAPGLLCWLFALLLAGFGILPFGSSALVAPGIYLFFLLVSGYGTWVRRHRIALRTQLIPIKDLPESLVGYRIAHLSDLHVGSFSPKTVAERWVQMANNTQPDMMVFTGDYVTSGVLFHQTIANVMGQARAKDGTFASMGNHDYYGDGQPLLDLLRNEGVTVLSNESHLVQRGDSELQLLGIDDIYTQRADVQQAMQTLKADVPTVVLAHDPRLFPQLVAPEVKLVLSGHTHGGQVAVPWLVERYNLARFPYQFTYGIYQEQTTYLYVHAGLGTTGLPIRLGAAPEIVVHVLIRA